MDNNNKQIQKIKPLLEQKIPDTVKLKIEFQKAKKNGLIVLRYNNIRYYKFHQVDDVAAESLVHMRPLKSEGGFRYFGSIHSFQSNHGLITFFINDKKEKAYFNKCDVFIDGKNIDINLPFYNFMYNGMPVELYVTPTKFNSSEERSAKYKAEYVGCHPVYFGVVETILGTTGFIQFLKERSHERAYFHKDFIWVNGKKSNITSVDEVIQKSMPVMLVVQFFSDKMVDASYKSFFVMPFSQCKNKDILRSIPAQIDIPLGKKTSGTASKQLYYIPGITGTILRYLSCDTGIVQVVIRGKRYNLSFSLNGVKVPPNLAMMPLQDCLPCNSRVYLDAYIYTDKQHNKAISLWLGKKKDCVPICNIVHPPAKNFPQAARNTASLPVVSFSTPAKNFASPPHANFPAAAKNCESLPVDSFSSIKKPVLLPVDSFESIKKPALLPVHNFASVKKPALLPVDNFASVKKLIPLPTVRSKFVGNHTENMQPVEKTVASVQNASMYKSISHTCSFGTSRQSCLICNTNCLSQQLGTVESFISDETGIICYNYCGDNESLIFHKNVVSFPINEKNINLQDYLQVGQRVYFNGQFSRPNIISSFVFTKVWPLREYVFNSKYSNCSVNQTLKLSIAHITESPGKDMTKLSAAFGDENTCLTKITSFEENEEENIVMDKKESVLRGVVKNCAEDVGILVGISEELSFTRDAAYFYGVPLQNYDLQAIFKQGDEVFYIHAGSEVKKVWLRCDVNDAKLSNQDLQNFCEIRKLPLYLTNRLIQDFTRLYLVKDKIEKELHSFNNTDACGGKSVNHLQFTESHTKNIQKNIFSGTKYNLSSIINHSLNIENGEVDSDASCESCKDTSFDQSSKEQGSVSSDCNLISGRPNMSPQRSSLSDDGPKMPSSNNNADISCLSNNSSEVSGPISNTSSSNVSFVKNTKKDTSFISDAEVPIHDNSKQHVSLSGSFIWDSKSVNFDGYAMVNSSGDKEDALDPNEYSPVISINNSSDNDLSSSIYFSDDDNLDNGANSSEETNWDIPSPYKYVKELEICSDFSSARSHNSSKKKVCLSKKQEYELKYYEGPNNNHSCIDNHDSSLQVQERNKSSVLQIDSNYENGIEDLQTFQTEVILSGLKKDCYSENHSAHLEHNTFLPVENNCFNPDDAACSLLCRNESQLRIAYLKPEKKLHKSADINNQQSVNNYQDIVHESIGDTTYQIMSSDFMNSLIYFLNTKLSEERFQNLPHLYVDRFIKHLEHRFYDVLCEELKESFTRESEGMTENASINQVYNTENAETGHTDNALLINEVIEYIREEHFQIQTLYLLALEATCL